MEVECQSPTDVSTVSIQFATQNTYDMMAATVLAL